MSRFLEDMAQEIKRQGLNVLRIAEIRQDGEPEVMTLGQANICMNTYSVAKSFSAAAAGLLYDRGLLGMDERIVDILKKYLPEKYDPRWNLMTVDMVLRHHCGFKAGYLDIDVADLNPVTGGDYLGYLFATMLECDPGTAFCYSDAAFYLISRVVAEKTGRGMDDYLWENLFLPLGFREAAWSHCPHGYAMGGTGLYINAGDMAKLAAVYLNGGLYHGKRIFSEKWVALTLEKKYTLSPQGNGAFGKGGMYGQMILGIRKQRRAVAWQSVEEKSTSELINWVVNYEE